MPDKREPIDWEAVRQGLVRAHEALAALDDGDRAHEQRILHERVAALARPVDGPRHGAAGRGEEVLVFGLGGERYGLQTVHVAEVMPMAPLTAIPGVPDFVAGVAASRIGVLAVNDLRVLLDLPLARLEEPAAIIVLQDENMAFGIFADVIHGVERYAMEAMAPDLPTLGAGVKAYLKGVAPDRTAILDGALLLSDTRLIVDAG